MYFYRLLQNIKWIWIIYIISINIHTFGILITYILLFYIYSKSLCLPRTWICHLLVRTHTHISLSASGFFGLLYHNGWNFQILSKKYKGFLLPKWAKIWFKYQHNILCIWIQHTIFYLNAVWIFSSPNQYEKRKSKFLYNSLKFRAWWIIACKLVVNRSKLVVNRRPRGRAGRRPR